MLIDRINEWMDMLQCWNLLLNSIGRQTDGLIVIVLGICVIRTKWVNVGLNCSQKIAFFFKFISSDYQAYRQHQGCEKHYQKQKSAFPSLYL